MASLNKVLLMGNLTRDPETRYTTSGSAVCALGLAVNRRFVSRGEERDETCFIDLEVWGKQAEACQTYLHKGSPIFVEGRLRYDQWEDRETGRKRSRLLVTAERVQFLSSRGGGGDEGGGRGSYPDPRPVQQPAYSERPTQSAPVEQTAPPVTPPAMSPQTESVVPPAMPEKNFESQEPIDDIPF